MSTAEQKVTSTLERDADSALEAKHRPLRGSGDSVVAAALASSQRPVVTAITAAELAAKVRDRAPVGARPADSVNDWLRVRHIVAAHRAEAMRLADGARWSQHNADVCWYSGKLRVARQFDAQATRQRALAAWLTAEADALNGATP